MKPFALAFLLASPLAAAAADVPEDWAFKPLKPAAPPTACGNPIDAFVLAKLDAAKLSPSPAADKATLFRRLNFDTTGLPPTPEALRTFLADTSKDAYVQAVDRLLASPHFGEKAALNWLDVVRYAETDGFNQDATRPHAWRYRDYVIRSLNADKPWDRFLKEQVAGDELYPNDPDAWIATGFLRHYPDEYNAVNLEQRRQEILNDITDTLGTAALGVTLACCRCHDHKTDPIPQADYYRLQAFFAGYSPVQRAANPADQAAYDKALAAWEAATAEVRAKMEDVVRPAREKAMAKERSRFAPEYQALLDRSPADLTPLERQLRAMIALQVNDKHSTAVEAAKLKGPEKEKYDALAKELAAFDKLKPKPLALAAVMTDVAATPPPTHLLKRGNWQNPGDVLSPGYLSTVDATEPKVTPTAATPGRRAALANWITGEANPLFARAAVNRIWQQYFGRGLVGSSGDLGSTGDRPTHPELLDDLALEFRKAEYKPKAIHRLILTSETYRQTSRSTEGAKVDPENLLLWRAPRKRLDGESLRDAVLAVSGELNPKLGGPSVYPELPAEVRSAAKDWKPSADLAERNRRSVYVHVKRNLRFPLFALFDSPDRNEACSRRFVTTTAPQALNLLNDPIILAQAKAFAERVVKAAGADDGKAVAAATEIALNRPPTTEEAATMKAFLAKHAGTREEALTDLCHGLLNLNEFLYID